MGAKKAITATEFETTGLDLLERVEAGELPRMEVRRAGRIVVALTAPPASATRAEELHGFLPGSVKVPPSIGLPAPDLLNN